MHSKSIQNHTYQVNKDSILDASVGIRWSGFDCLFSDWLFISNLNLWRDHLPAEMAAQITGLYEGDRIHYLFAAGKLLEDWDKNKLVFLDRKQFSPPQKDHMSGQPRIGRFYPKDYFIDVPHVYQGNEFSCRICAIDDQQIKVDFNHPLAGKEIDMMLEVDSIKQNHGERGGRCNDVTAMICDLGSGMQDRLKEIDTDFWTDNPFQRNDTENDSVFFKTPALSPYWDRIALDQVTRLYSLLVPNHAEVLDLMGGVHSPLQESGLKIAGFTSAALNQQEMDRNPICSEAIVLDVNNIERLPFKNEQFDIVLIHAAIEYVIHPEMIFSEISRILKPGGRIIISFSNRYVPEKVIYLWSGAHEFERPGIVLSYLRSTGKFKDFNSYSKGGLLRPQDDHLADHLFLSDPVYVVWADKK
jgi:SAM-dependent methyltransferase